MSKERAYLRLVWVKGGSAGEYFDFHSDKITLGRSTENDLVVNSVAVSRRHAVIERASEAAPWIITDSGSQSGVFVNGAKRAKNELADGDIVSVGDCDFRVETHGESPMENADTESVDVSFAKTGTRTVKANQVTADDLKAIPKKQETKANESVGPAKKKPLIKIAAGFLALTLILAVGIKMRGGADTQPALAPQKNDPIPIQFQSKASGAYGLIPFSGMDKSHADLVDFSFSPKSKKVVVTYSLAGIASLGEVVISLNGFKIGEGEITMDWSFPREITLPSEYISVNTANILRFDNVHNPPQTAPWGVRHVSMTDLGGEPCDNEKAMKSFNLGKNKYESRLITADNLVRGYESLRESMIYWDACPSKPAEYEQADKLKSAAKVELDNAVNQKLIEVESFISSGNKDKALTALKKMLRMFYDQKDARLEWINEKGYNVAN